MYGYVRQSDMLMTTDPGPYMGFPYEYTYQDLSDADLLNYAGWIRCELIQPTLEWWETFTEPTLDQTTSPRWTMTIGKEMDTVENLKGFADTMVRDRTDQRVRNIYCTPPGETEETHYIMHDVQYSEFLRVAVMSLDALRRGQPNELIAVFDRYNPGHLYPASTAILFAQDVLGQLDAHHAAQITALQGIHAATDGQTIVDIVEAF